MVFPATSAPPAGPAASASGKLNGAITAHTPYGQHARVFLTRAKRSELQLEAFVLFDLIAVVLDQIRRLFDVTDALEAILAGLVAHQSGELPAPRADSVGDFLQERDALAPRPRAPR